MIEEIRKIVPCRGVLSKMRKLLPASDLTSSPAAEPISITRRTDGPFLDVIQARIRDLQGQLADYRMEGQTTRKLEEMLGSCRSRGIKVILVIPPLTSMHCNCYTEQVNAVFMQYINCLRRIYACQFVDCQDRLPDSCFVDDQHVLPSAADQFSDLFCREVLGPAWRTQRRRFHSHEVNLNIHQ
jgi:hypothetical protein